MLGPLGGDPPGSSGAVDLPEPELSQLKGIARAVTEVSMFQRDRLGQKLAARPEYIGRLLELFKVCVGGCVGVLRGCCGGMLCISRIIRRPHSLLTLIHLSS